MQVPHQTLRKLRTRYEAHLDSGGHILRPKQEDVGREWLEHLLDGYDRSYAKRPTASGKTVSMADIAIGINKSPSRSDPIWDTRVVIRAPMRIARNQAARTLIDPELFGLDPSLVGLYVPEDDPLERKAALDAPILVVTDRSLEDLVAGKANGDRINIRDYGMILGDEVHMSRGPQTRAFLQEQVFGHVYFQGWTATDMFITGQTIGDYLFGRAAIPFHETTFREAVNAGEIAPFKNIIVRTNIEPGFTIDADRELTEGEQERIAMQAGRDEIAIEMFAHFRDPETGIRLRDLPSIWFAASIKHAKQVAEKLNARFDTTDPEIVEAGEGFAVAVSGQTHPRILDDILTNFTDVEHPTKALCNNKLLVAALNAKNAAFAAQLVPHRAPIRVAQMQGRIGRNDPNNPHKISYHLTLLDKGMPDAAIVGEVLGGQWIAPPGFEMPEKTSSGGKGPDEMFPEASGIRVYATKPAFLVFEKEQQEQRWRKGLPKKTDDWLNVEEMAALVGVKPETLQPFYNAVEDALNESETRQKYIRLLEEDIGETLPKTIRARGQRFAVERIGHRMNAQNKAEFCCHKDQIGVFKHLIFGKIIAKPDDLLTKAQARTLLNVPADDIAEGLERLATAFRNRRPYQRVLILVADDGTEIKAPIGRMGYYSTTGGKIDFYIPPETLKALREYLFIDTPAEAKTWWERKMETSNLKTAEWKNREEMAELVGVETGNREFNKLWDALETKFSKRRATTYGKERHTVNSAKKLSGKAEIFCLHESECEWIKYKLGLDTTYEPGSERQR